MLFQLIQCQCIRQFVIVCPEKLQSMRPFVSKNPPYWFRMPGIYCSLIIFLMCEHTRRPKLFCLLENCQHPQCCACSSCMKQFHNHGIESYLSEKEVSELLMRMELPNTLKDQRKQLQLKLYKFLSRLKAELASNLESIFSDLMSKVKYPFLYKTELLDSYRQIRDKHYQRLVPESFRLFCRTAKSLAQSELLAEEELYYSQHLKEVGIYLCDVPQRMATVSQAFGFKLGPEVEELFQDCMKEIQSHNIPKSLRKSDSPKSINKLKMTLSSPKKVQKGSKDFLTPSKSASKNDVSLDNISLKGLSDHEKSSRKSGLFDEHGRLSASIEIAHDDVRKRSTSKGSHIIDPLEGQRLQKSLSLENVEETKGTVSNQTELNNVSNYSESYSYEEGNSKGMCIKVSDAKIDSQPAWSNRNDTLTKSTDIKPQLKEKREQGYRKKSFNQSMNSYIKEREEKIRKRLDDLKMEKQSQEDKNKPADEPQNPTKSLQAKPKFDIAASQQHASRIQSREVLDSPPIMQKKIEELSSLTERKQKGPISRVHVAKAEVKHYSILQSHQKRHSSPVKRENNNVSLLKNVAHREAELEKSQEKIHNNLGNITKEIPLVAATSESSPRRRLLQRKDSLQTTEEEELKASCILMRKLEGRPGTEELERFLQDFVGKYENCITGVEYLSFVYLQVGKAKQSLLLCSSYLEKLDSLNVRQSTKLNLLINKAAALNTLGRDSETVALLSEKLNVVEHEKLHKNLGDAYFHLGDKDNAIYHYEKATKLNPRYGEAYYNLAVMLYLQESYFNALMNMEKAVLIEPKEGTYMELLAAIRERITNSR